MGNMTIDEVLRHFAYGYITVVAAGKVIEIKKEDQNDGD